MWKKASGRKLFILFIVFSFFALFFVFSPNIVSVHALESGDLGMEYGEQTQLSSTDPRLVIARIIQILLGFLAILAVMLIVYAGFLWMTAKGDEAQVQKSKDTLKNAVIGLIIILTAFGIVTLLLGMLMRILNAPAHNTPSQGGGYGFGVAGICAVDSYYPIEGANDIPRNTVIMVTFREEVDPKSVCQVDASGECANSDEAVVSIAKSSVPDVIHICKIAKGGSSICDMDQGVTVKISSSDNKTFIFNPVAYLGSSEKNTDYVVRLTGNIKKANGKSIFENCPDDFFEWNFTVSNKLDFEPPQIKSIFPYPDNSKDVESVINPEQNATGSIEVLQIPNIYTTASIKNISTNAGTMDLNNSNFIINDNSPYGGWLKIVFSGGGWGMCQIADENSDACITNLGTGEISGMYNVEFPNVLTLKLDNEPPEGSFEKLEISPMVKADSITVGSNVYVFVSDSIPSTELKANEIKIGPTTATVASNIANKTFVKINSSVNASNNNMVDFTAFYSGKAGNNIVLKISNNTRFSVVGMHGGSDGDSEYDSTPDGITDNNVTSDKYTYKLDEYINAVPQITFTEAIMPYKIEDSVKLINAKGSSNNGGSCSDNSDCYSFKCDGSVCIGDYLAGEILLSNQYKTFNFRSNNKCGVNSCGETMYCLPENSNIKVVINASSLLTCSNDNDCVAYAPYSSCDTNSTSKYYHTCIDKQGDTDPNNNIPLPMADQINLNGIVDTALNSLNGNRNYVVNTSNGDFIYRDGSSKKIGYAEGDGDTYEENKPDVILDIDLDPSNDGNNGDNFIWSFWTNDEIKYGEPVIDALSPVKDSSVITDSFSKPINIDFDSLILSYSLKTGSIYVYNGTENIEHKLINLWNFGQDLSAYWITQDGIDNGDLDMYANFTRAYINHTDFSANVTYRAQVGSGVKDIYQNCFKPSAGPACTGVSAMNPSCCNGSVVSGLDENGNCK